MDLSGMEDHEPESVSDQEREAAVVVPVLDNPNPDPDPNPDLDPDPDLLFTKRADHLADHPGQMSFPGGGHEPEDADLRETALREASEEVGLRPGEVDCVGRLDDIRTVTRYSVRPFVGRVPDRSYEPCDEEVAEVAIIPFSGLTDLDNYDSERRDHPYYGDIRLHYFRVEEYTVWGATARILVQFLELVTDWDAPAEPDRVVDADADYPV